MTAEEKSVKYVNKLYRTRDGLDINLSRELIGH